MELLKGRPLFYLFTCLCFALLLTQIPGFNPGATRPLKAFSAVIISEVAWAGTAADESDEWIELHNSNDSAVDLVGWRLTSADGLDIALNGTIPSNGFFLLERDNDNTIFDVPADQFFISPLNNAGTSLTLINSSLDTVDTANFDGGAWPAGSGDPDHLSMERASPNAPDDDSGWVNNSLIRNGIDSEGNHIAGTPGQPNSTWPIPEKEIDLAVELFGPSSALAGSTFDYRISYQNNGEDQATDVVLTSTLPNGIVYLSDNSGLPLTIEGDKNLQWSMGEIGPGSQGQFDLKVKVEATISGTQTNIVKISAKELDIEPSNNSASLTTVVIGQNDEIDLSVELLGPSTADAGSTFNYRISYQNKGEDQATDVVLTSTLPYGIVYLSDNSGLPLTVEGDKNLQWSVGEIGSGSQGQFDLKVKVEATTSGTQTKIVAIWGKELDVEPSNNSATLTTVVIGQSDALILIDAVLYDGYELNDADEAVYLINIGTSSADLSGWKLTDNTSSAIFPPGSFTDAGEGIWVTRNAAAFRTQFGFDAEYESADSDPLIPGLDGSWPGFSNVGDEVVLLNSEGQIIDVLVYEGGLSTQSGWTGPALSPYTVSGLFGEEGQILYRKRNSETGLPAADTDSAADWAQSKDDIYGGRKIRYPGWAVDEFFFNSSHVGNAGVKIAISPDNSFQFLSSEIAGAETSIYIETHTFRSYAVAQSLVDAAKRGVEVIVLLEGAPVGGLADSVRLNCQLLEEVQGQCWFMISDGTQRIQDRYRYLHSKFMIIDGRKAIISSENLSPSSHPDDSKSDGTMGQRGVLVATDAPGIVEGLQSVWEADFDPRNHQDLLRWSEEHPVFGAPPAGTEPITVTGGTEYSVRFPAYKQISDAREFIIEQSPENSLRRDQGTMAVLKKAGSGDVILAQQLAEDPHWGPGSSGRAQDPNPRLEAMIAAAQRGAKVLLLLDGFYDFDGENKETCNFLNQIAKQDQLDLACMLANPAGEGIHNKMILFKINGKGYVHIGSITSGERN